MFFWSLLHNTLSSAQSLPIVCCCLVHDKQMTFVYYLTIHASKCLIRVYIFETSTFADAQHYRSSEFGYGAGQIVLDAVQCSSSDSHLLACPSSPILTFSSYCDHSRNAGVGCEGMLQH